MTIAAGFNCIDGIILATDLEITESLVKRPGGKSTFEEEDGNAVAGAGVYDLLTYACEVITSGIRGQNLKQLLKKVRRDIKDMYRQHIHPFYEPNERDGVLQVLVAIEVDYECPPMLFKSSRSVLTQVAAPYEFVGIGRDLAYYIMKNQ